MGVCKEELLVGYATGLLVAPLVVLAGVAAAFLPIFDPAHDRFEWGWTR